MLVIGYGNPLRGDDGAGWVAANTLRQRRPDVDVQIQQALTPELVDIIAAAPLVVFIDARAGARPGHVRIERVDHDGSAGASAHGLSPAALLDWTARLFGVRPAAYLVTIEGERFAFGEALSPEVEHAIPEALAATEWLERALRTIGRGARGPSPTAACSRR